MTVPVRGALLVVLITWLALAGYILGRFANDAFPTFYLVRPLLGAIPFAVLIGLSAAWRFPIHAPLAALVGVGLLTFWGTLARRWQEVAAGLVVLLAVLLIARWRRMAIPPIPRAASTAATVFVVVFFVSGVARAYLGAEGPVTPVLATQQATGPNLYLVLLDGYPRGDTLLADLGIDNAQFEGALAQRGFDVYHEATSDRRYTDVTLMTLLTGTVVGVPPDTAPASEVQWLVRRALSEAALPRQAQEAGYEYHVIDSPAGHVTFSAGIHHAGGGLNTLEEYMLTESLLGPAVDAFFPMLPTDSLRAHLDASVNDLLALVDPDAHRLVLAHLFQPHLPFLWDGDGSPLPVPAAWPQANLYAAQIEVLGITLEDYSAAMAGDLLTLNAQLLGLVDEIVARDPGAVIVLFSDHGARYSEDLKETEWYRTFLAARTPGHPELFADDPKPTTILKLLLPTYVTGGVAP